MKISEYIPLAVRTEKPLPALGRLAHGCMGILTEIGEVVSELKRVTIYGKPLDAERKANILEEIGDVMWYVAIILDTTGLTPQVSNVTRRPMTNEDFQQTCIKLGYYCGQICMVTHEATATDNLKCEASWQLPAAINLIIMELQSLSLSCSSTLEKDMAYNIGKLKIRYPDKYTDEAAEGRADKTE